MATRPNARSWNDVQTAIATVAVVTTLGLWNLFATPSKAKVVQSSAPVIPPTEPPVDTGAPAGPTAMPQVKIIFTPGADASTIIQAQTDQQASTKKKRKKDNGGGGTVSITQTKTS